MRLQMTNKRKRINSIGTTFDVGIRTYLTILVLFL